MSCKPRISEIGWGCHFGRRAAASHYPVLIVPFRKPSYLPFVLLVFFNSRSFSQNTYVSHRESTRRCNSVAMGTDEDKQTSLFGLTLTAQGPPPAGRERCPALTAVTSPGDQPRSPPHGALSMVTSAPTDTPHPLTRGYGRPGQRAVPLPAASPRRQGR